jgi:dTDP-4-amino-4,6-dideoxygalactose transaminase
MRGESAAPPRRVPLARPSFGPEEERLLVEALRSGWVTQGPRVEEFEERFAEAVGAPFAVALSSGTAALFLALHAQGIGPGDEVIAPSLTFIASVNAIVHAGATPVLADVDPRTCNLDPAAVAEAVTPRTRAVLLVHQLGLPADLDAFGELAGRHGLLLVEDAACAVGARHRGRPIGASGNPCAFSFHPRKVLVTGEGGMLTTADGELARRLRRLRHQGMSVSDLERHRAERAIVETYPEVGYNFRLSDLHAAVGIAQLAKLEELLASRRRIAARYDAALAGSRVEAREAPPWATPNHQSYLVRLRGAGAAARDRVLDRLHRRGVGARRGLMAVHREPAYRDRPPRRPLPHTEAAEASTLVLPIFPGLEADDQGYVIEELRAAVEEALGEFRGAA